MSHNHHNPCKHDLKFCVRCDIPYCANCQQEWTAPCNQSHVTWWAGTGGGSMGTTTTVTVPMNQVLTNIWNNHEDCVYDAIGAGA